MRRNCNKDTSDVGGYTLYTIVMRISGNKIKVFYSFSKWCFKTNNLRN